MANQTQIPPERAAVLYNANLDRCASRRDLQRGCQDPVCPSRHGGAGKTSGTISPAIPSGSSLATGRIDQEIPSKFD